MSEFDSRASSWDENPMHLDRSIHVARKMEEMIPLTGQMSALEYGAGTGILSFLLSDRLAEITMMDNSSEMVRVMNEKVLARNKSNLLPVFFNLEQAISDIKFDLIFNQMVLHHIHDISTLFNRFGDMLVSGGYLAIADLYPEDGSFHGGNFDGHFGFEPMALKEQLIHAGFENVRHEHCYTVERRQPDGSTKTYPIFLLTASKPLVQ